jgi:hypothetical protein
MQIEPSLQIVERQRQLAGVATAQMQEGPLHG